MKVLKLSPEPDIQDQLFGNLCGPFQLRVCAVNRAGRGTCVEQSIILSGGYKLFTVFFVWLKLDQGGILMGNQVPAKSLNSQEIFGGTRAFCCIFFGILQL